METNMNETTWKTTPGLALWIRDQFTELMLQDMMTLMGLIRNHAGALHQLFGEFGDFKTSLNNVATLSKRAASMAASKKLSPDALKKLMESPLVAAPVKDARVPSAN